jgi:hypothetical protein
LKEIIYSATFADKNEIMRKDNDLNEEELNRKYKVHLSEHALCGKYHPIVVEGNIEEYFAEKGNANSKQLMEMINKYVKVDIEEVK